MHIISCKRMQMDKNYLFLMSASLRPSLGVSTVSIIALYPLLSTLFTILFVTSRLLYTYNSCKKELSDNKGAIEKRNINNRLN